MRGLALMALAVAVVGSPGAGRSQPAGTAPSGGKIVFTRTVDASREDRRELHVMNADGSGLRKLTRGVSDDTDPVWAPDGRRIAFVSQRPRSPKVWTFNIYLVNSNGGAVRRLTDSRWSDSPVWSPDGSRIAFIRRFPHPPGNQVGSTTPEIFVMNADGSGERRLTRNKLHEFSLGWSRSGKLAFARGPGLDNTAAQIFVMNPDGSGLQRLTRNRFYQAEAHWSPNGQQIAFVRSSRNPLRSSVWVMNADGSGQRRLTPTFRADPDGIGLAWSPDGSKIALNWGSRPGIYTMNADGSGLRRVTRREVGLPTWSPDSRRIAFHRWPAIYVANADGTGQRRLLPRPGARLSAHGENWSPVWSP